MKADNKPSVSVIVPNYNHASYLKQRLESVFNQTYKNFEVIILDDCSDDNSREIIEQYRNHPKVTAIVYNSKNSGSTFKQWDKGIQLAKGQWIWIAESDDWCEHSFLDEVIPVFTDKDYDKIVISYCGSIIIRGNEVVSYPNMKDFTRTMNGEEFIKCSMIEGNSIYNASMCVFRNDKSVDFSEIYSYQFCGDWVFWIQLSTRGVIRSSAKCLNYFRKHDTDVSGKSFRIGTFHKEYILLLKSLLQRGLIDNKDYKERIFSKVKTIKSYCDKDVVLLIRKCYRKELGLWYYYFGAIEQVAKIKKAIKIVIN